MAVKFTDATIDDIVSKYQNGMSVKDLGEMFGVHYQTISRRLKERGVFIPKTHNWTETDTQKLLEVYPTGDWDLILKTFPSRTREVLYSQASKFGIHSYEYFWTQHDKDILIDLYGDIDTCDIQKMLDREYTIRQIQNQAKKMNLTKNREWTEDEVAILIDKYESVGSIGVSCLLPGRSNRAIIGKAMSLGLRCDCYWTEEEKQFLINNWECMTDVELSEALGRGVKGVADQRRKLGLYYPRNDISYYDVADFIRHRNDEWKRLSMQKCQYQCVITKSSDFEIHHTYSFNLILKEAMQDSRWIDKDITEYTDDELNYILSIFCEYQSKYPLGVCVAPEYHRMFHSLYGNRVNTPDQWEEFLKMHINTPITD